MLQHKFVKKELIDKGWSRDKKYCITDKQGNKFLLRVSPIEQYERKKSEYELMSQVAALGVPMCKPLEFGTSDEGVFACIGRIICIYQIIKRTRNMAENNS